MHTHKFIMHANQIILHTHQPARRQRGGAAVSFVLVMSALAAMLGTLAIRGAVTDLRVAGAQRLGKTGFYCAEAGLEASRQYFATNYSSWGAMFDTTKAPPAGYPAAGDLDGDGKIDFQVTLRDNVDEFAPQPNNLLRDNDLTAIMVSRCVSTTMGQRQLQQIVTVAGQRTDYRAQAGNGSRHSGNVN